MKTTTEARYRARVDEAIRLISARLADPPPMDELAREVGVSRFHFQRLYRAATGETLLETLARLRAIRALELLEAGADSVTEIAAAVGYDTPQAFARAFRGWTGFSPTEARAMAADLKARFVRPAHGAPAPIEVEIAALEPISLTIVHTRQPFGPLNAVYEELFAAVTAAGRLEDVRGIYGLPLNDPVSDPDRMVEHIAGLDVAGAAIAGREQRAIEGGRVARTRHTGPFEDLDDTASALYRRVLEEGLVLRDEPALYHHLDDPDDVAAEALRTDIYLQLEESQQ